MSHEMSAADIGASLAAPAEIRELSLAELTAVSGGISFHVDAVAEPPVSNGVLLAE